MLRVLIVLPLAMLSACATIVTGTSQTVTVSTEPAGATCTFDRAGSRVGAVPTTPGSVRLSKSGKDLSVECAKDGYETATLQQPSSFNGVTFGNVLAGGVIGFVVDASSGANFEYPADIRLALMAKAAPQSAPLASLPGAFSQAEPSTVRTGPRAIAYYPPASRLNQARASY